ncbi:MAG: formylglycine-generating enzyme family protein [Candidatus Cyclobacteriaceae bacterium M3_2C_046]
MKIFSILGSVFIIPMLIVGQSLSLAQPMQEQPMEIPGSDIKLDMVLIPAGEYQMGSPADQPKHQEDEAPQHTVKIDSFWMGKFEITWDLFELFLNKDKELVTSNEMADAVARPSPPYEDPSFGMGKYGYPAASMTQYSALMFCKWISNLTGEFYRLPTEAEWEYACKAGTETAYSFGDDVEKLDEYAWYYENSNYAYHKVGEKKPNPWGLYDMHGNVSEWTLDQYYPDFYTNFKDVPVAVNPWAEPVDLHPRSVKGGSYDDDPEALRSANRIASDPDRWKRRDPQIPKSFWWNTDSPFVGFRLVKPYKQPTEEELAEFWSITLDE